MNRASSFPPTLAPGDPGYHDARRVFNGMIDRYPALIARCATTDHVIAALEHARNAGLPLAVRGGGHSGPGFGVIDDGLVIDLSEMRAVDVDPAARTARVQGGATWAELDAATQRFGLAVTGGRVSSTGVGGFTLGSGSGWLERKLGFAADNLRSARVALADGRLITASATENRDLFWALRGGGGNFGIVVEFEFAVHPIGPIVLGGMLLHPFDEAGSVIREYRDWIERSPEDMCGGIALITAPPAAFVPESLRGQRVMSIVVLHAGEIEAGRHLVNDLRRRRPAAADLVEPMPYTGLQTLMDEANPAGVRDYFKAGFLDEMTDGAIDAFVRCGEEMISPLTALVLQPLGGAIARVADTDTALGHRQARWAFQALSLWFDPAEDKANIAWARDVARELAPHSRSGMFPNFIAEADEQAIRDSYGARRYQRLAAIKRRYDPDNLFRHNHNIAPTPIELAA